MRMSDRARRGIFARLIHEHRQVTAMMEQIEASAYDASVDRDARFAALAKELVVHARAEDQVLYATLELYESTSHLVRVGREEHSLVEHLIGQLGELREHDEQWMAKFQVLQDVVERHIEDEEDDAFDLAADIIDRGQAEEMLEEYEEARARESARFDASLGRRVQRDDRMLREEYGRH